jgi:hypothetical protein
LSKICYVKKVNVIFTYRIIEKEKFSQEIDVIITEIITKGTNTTPERAVQEQDDDDDRFKTFMEVINEDTSKERIVSTKDPQFVELLNDFKSSSSSDH